MGPILHDVIELTTKDNAVLLPVKIVPGASRNRYLGEWQGRARIAVAAAAEKGKANDAVVAYVADLLGIRERDVTIISGETNPLKTIRIDGVPIEAVRAALEPDRS